MPDITDFGSDGEGDHSLQLEYVRRFNHPTGLSPDDGVFLKFEGNDPGIDQIELNGQRLADFRFDTFIEITSLLLPANQIAVRLVESKQPARLLAEVNLWLGRLA